MPKTRCAYEGCYNTKKKKPSLNFHRFPKPKERRTQWILRSGNLSLMDLSEPAIRNKHLCSEHFSVDDIKHFNRGSEVLKKTALPIAYSLLSTGDVSQGVAQEPIEDPPTVYEDQPISASQNNTDKGEEFIAKLQAQLAAANEKFNLLKNAITSRDQNEVNELISKVDHYKKVAKEQSKKILNLENKLKKNEEEETFQKNLKKLHKSVLDFFHMQVNHHVKQRKWRDGEKQFSISLYQKSSEAYSYLRYDKQFALPCVSLVQTWISELDNPS